MVRQFIYTVVISLLFAQSFAATAPFIPLNEIHAANSEFELNLILNQNRNIPIILLQFSRDNTLSIISNMIQNAFQQEKDISFAVTIDCRKVQYDLNHSLGLCRNFQSYKQESINKEEDNEKINDQFFRFDFFSPNPTKIKQKGHLLYKNHDTQNLRDLNENVNSQYLSKIIRNQIPDFITYIEDQHDLDQYLKTHSEFRLSKGPKIIYFDQNLQAPLFIKKLAVNLDGRIKVAVSDSIKLASAFSCKFEDLALLEYDFEFGKYQIQKILYEFQDPLSSILALDKIKRYTEIKKPRDILLDFQHKQPTVYNFSNLKQVNHLISHGRIIILQISSAQPQYSCPQLQETASKYGVLFNYICLSLKAAEILLTATQTAPSNSWFKKIFFIDGSLKNAKILASTKDLYDQLPQTAARQQITTVGEGQYCVRAAKGSQRQPLFFYFNQKTHQSSLNIVKYFNSLQEVNSILYFCQFYVPDQQVRDNYQLHENTIFTLGTQDQYGHIQKIQHKKMQDFNSIKMFLREIAISKMMKIYDEKVMKNELIQITSAQQLTHLCFSSKCIIALIQTDKFHSESQKRILKQIQLSFSDSGLKFVWIDGICHFEVGKQLKLIEKGSKAIDRSYMFLYQQKTNEYSLWKSGKLNKFWDKKQVFRWVKSLRSSKSISRIKFGIDIEDKQCLRTPERLKEKDGTSAKIAKPSIDSNKKDVKQAQL